MSKRKQQQLEALLSPFTERTSTKVGSVGLTVIIDIFYFFSLLYFGKADNQSSLWLLLIMPYSCACTIMTLERILFWRLQLSPQQVDLRVARLLPLAWQIPWGAVSSTRVETRKEVSSSFSPTRSASTSSQDKCRLALTLQDGRTVRSCWLTLTTEEVKRMGEVLALCQSSARKESGMPLPVRSIHWGFVGVRIAVMACWILVSLL